MSRTSTTAHRHHLYRKGMTHEFIMKAIIALVVVVILLMIFYQNLLPKSMQQVFGITAEQQAARIHESEIARTLRTQAAQKSSAEVITAFRNILRTPKNRPCYRSYAMPVIPDGVQVTLNQDDASTIAVVVGGITDAEADAMELIASDRRSGVLCAVYGGEAPQNLITKYELITLPIVPEDIPPPKNDGGEGAGSVLEEPPKPAPKPVAHPPYFTTISNIRLTRGYALFINDDEMQWMTGGQEYYVFYPEENSNAFCLIPQVDYSLPRFPFTEREQCVGGVSGTDVAANPRLASIDALDVSCREPLRTKIQPCDFGDAK